MKFNFPLTNFSSGEWSPKMIARLDTEQYVRACKELTNIIPQIQGSAVYRGATVSRNSRIEPEEGAGGDPLEDQEAFQFYLDYWADQFYSGTDRRSNIKMIPYFGSYDPSEVFSGSGTPPVGFFIFVNGFIAFTRDGGRGLEPIPFVFPVSWVPRHAADVHYAQVGDLVILVDNSGANYPLIIRPDGSGSFEISSWYNASLVPGKAWAAIPWGKLNALGNNVTISASATTGTVTLTASASYFTSDMVGAYIRLCNGSNDEGVATITAYTSATSVTATVVKTLPNASFQYGASANPSSFWQLQAWYSGNWPKTITCFQGRIIFGGTPEQPDTIWGSRIGSYFNFEEIPSPNTTGTFGYADGAYLADNSRPFELTSNSPEASNIVSLCSSKTLMINTDRSEIVAYGAQGALGPNDVQFESSSSFGAESVQPVRVNNFMTFVERGGKAVRDITFNFQEDQYRSTNLSFMSEHFFRSRIYQEKDDAVIEELCSFKYGEGSTLLAARDRRGRLFSCTLDRDYQINAWAQIPLGVSPEQQAEDVLQRIGVVAAPEDYFSPARCLAICAVPAYSYLYDVSSDTVTVNRRPKTYVAVIRMRTVSGTNSWYLSIEELAEAWERPQPRNSGEIALSPVASYNGQSFILSPETFPHYLDAAEYAMPADATTPYDGTVPTKEWKVALSGAGVTPMRGQTVSVYADSVYVGEVTISDDDETGTFTLQEEASNVVLGYKYVGRIVLMPIEQGGQIGPAKGRIKRIDEIVLDLYNTGSIKFGVEGQNLNEIPIWTGDLLIGQAAEYFTGIKPVEFIHGLDRRQCVVVEAAEPVPLHLLSVSARGVTYD